MQTREAPDFWGLYKNKNFSFSLKYEYYAANEVSFQSYFAYLYVE